MLGIVGVGLIVEHRMAVGTDSLHGIVFTLASLASIVAGTILSGLWFGRPA